MWLSYFLAVERTIDVLSYGWLAAGAVGVVEGVFWVMLLLVADVSVVGARHRLGIAQISLMTFDVCHDSSKTETVIAATT